jgi:ribosomal protein L37E
VLLIFGFRSYVRTLAMLTLVCRNCGNPAAHRLYEVTRKFTLFFVPLFPVSRKYGITCAACGVGTRISAEDKDRLLASAAAPQPAAPAQPAAIDD